ncbi:PREDICTED: prefoldin subunit 1-like [Amphimedon queenslandica]|uniref:Prefoldin subunit 1 n=2 Tax=Amphimedon queenslandica TaxID=400682 RepID=A0AAN0IJN4_AMPQE|nr:PREDICTED: prefoldin subunit 1-like [Amphimedon queenslandica]|eukprot:XP_003391893.2 PREDICTED: prefoldin subunit 1-like [Amphimedon queenslandica]
MADPELTKAFSEHHTKMIETNANVTRIQQQMEDLKSTARSSQLTERVIASLPEGTRLYESIGRLFVLTAAAEVKEHMKTNQEEAQQKIKQLEVPD